MQARRGSRQVEQGIEMQTFNDPQFNKKMIDQRNTELEALRGRSKAPPMGGNDEKLFSYMFGRALLDRPIDGSEAQRLRRANDTVEAVRAHLDRGRGNVSTDIARSSHESSRWMAAGRELRDEMAKGEGPVSESRFGMLKALSSELVRAGNCGEHGDLSMHLHGDKLVGKETLQRVSSAQIDHGWAELRVSGAGFNPSDVVMDAWGKGPAVLREDSTFAASRAQLKPVKYALDQVSGPKAAQDFQQQRTALHANQQLGRFAVNSFKALEKSNYQVAADHVFAPTPVLSQTFRNAADKSWQQSSKVTLSEQIKATGVARTLGENVSNATRRANTLSK
ncbi:hypothetical protein N8I74_09675 [Chitiniphilus purpureus]|uniref:Uncharacterized protein n=1 Tax=Chitiniphilus purpureus TaxID=2981137 RepID=A0ABY6DSB5_9NEIS|nr:hypothetical protein [Chitiniphilus sp. CD1]UXY17255.1 hypothetical protein N8I74_09675 [Chitiniphilus sp. CD1]